MKRWILALASAAMVVPALGATSTAAPRGGEDQLDLYTMRVEADQVAGLQQAGVDVVKARNVGSDVEIDAVLTPDERDRLRSRGVDVRVKRNRDGKSQRQLAAEHGGGRVHRVAVVRRTGRDPRPALRAGERQSKSRQARGARPHLPGSRDHRGQGHAGCAASNATAPVRRSSTPPRSTHGSGSRSRSTGGCSYHFVDGWRDNDKEIRKLLKKTELWFILVANPDGYQYTFDVERLWRKNLRDNDGDGAITVRTASTRTATSTSTGTTTTRDRRRCRPARPTGARARCPSPRPRRWPGLLDRIKPKFQSNWHSNGEWILYPQGWQVGSPEADNPIYVALAGTDANPAIAGFDPGISSDELYVTNGETTDYADTVNGHDRVHARAQRGLPRDVGSSSPTTRRWSRRSSSARCRSRSPWRSRRRARPTRSRRSGITAKPFYLDQARHRPREHALVDVRLHVRRVLRRPAGRCASWPSASLGAGHGQVADQRRPPRRAPTSEWTGGERLRRRQRTYYRVDERRGDRNRPGRHGRGVVRGRREDQRLVRRTTVVSDTGNRVLVLAAEDYTGASPVIQPGGPRPQYLSYYTDALTANGIPFDVYDVDANGRTAPDALGVLSHYDAVIWYTGDDVDHPRTRVGRQAPRRAWR